MFHNRQPRYIQKYTQHNVVFDQFKETTRFLSLHRQWHKTMYYSWPWQSEQSDHQNPLEAKITIFVMFVAAMTWQSELIWKIISYK